MFKLYSQVNKFVILNNSHCFYLMTQMLHYKIVK